MKEKLVLHKSEKGFSLVELVIVISILAIIAAIAIPVITTTINSSKISVMESDCESVNVIVKEAIAASMAHMDDIKYGAKTATDATLTIRDVFNENDINTNVLNSRIIGGSTYCIVWNSVQRNAVVSVTNTEWPDTTLIKDLIPA